MSEKFPKIKLDLDFVKSLFRNAGCKNLYVKELAWNHDSKRQIYLTTDLSAFNIFPNKMELNPEMHPGIKSTQKKKPKNSDRIFGHLNFFWLTPDSTRDEAKHAKLIFYPQYPEVRLSGFLKGTKSIPSKFLREKSGETYTNRLLFLGTDKEENTFGFLAVSCTGLRKELRAEANYELDAAINRIEIRKGKSAEQRLISKLRSIHQAGWHKGVRLRKGVRIPCNASNAVGYTLEALLGIEPNGKNAPDYEGYEVKALTVSDFSKPTNKVVTVFTPEPDVGIYVRNFLEFMKEYGYDDLRGRPDRKNFGGIHRVGKRHDRTKLLLQLAGFKIATKDKYDTDGQLELVDEAKKLAAGWTFSKLVDGWKNKHEKAVYVPALKKISKGEFKFSNKIKICYGADFLCVLNSLFRGDLYLDPGVKVEHWSSKKKKTKKRNQFRAKASVMPTLYTSTKDVSL